MTIQLAGSVAPRGTVFGRDTYGVTSRSGYDVVIATRNRPTTLENCLRHFERQSVLPNQVIVVDSSEDSNLVRSRIMTSRIADVEWRFLTSDVQSTCYQRNLGLKQATSEVVFFPDDDSVFYPNSAEAILGAYAQDAAGCVAGVGGRPVLHGPQEFAEAGHSPHFKQRVAPLRNTLESRFVPQPFNTYPQELWARRSLPNWIDGEEYRAVQTIGGYLLTLRTAIAKRLCFDEVLGYGIGYALHEDMEFSMRAQMEGLVLVAAMKAPVFHDVHPGRRANGFNYGFCWILNYLYACRKTMPVSSRSYKIDLARFLRYKILLYRVRALASRSDYDRDVLCGAETAWRNRGELLDCGTDTLAASYRKLCDTYLEA